MRLVAIAFLFVLLVPSQAAGSAAVAGGFIVAGPALAGTDVVWADRPTRLAGAVTLRRLTAAGTAQVELVRADCGPELDLAASKRYIALSGCGGNQIVVAGLDVPDPAPLPCAGPMDVLEDELIAAGCSVGVSPLNLFTLTTGTRTGLPAQLGSGRTLLQVRIAGDRLATLTSGGTPTPTPSPTPTPVATATPTASATPTPTVEPDTTPRFVSIYDRAAFTPQLDVSLATLTGPDSLEAPTLRLGLEQDGGTVLVGAGQAGTNSIRYAWASLTSPFLTEIPGAFISTDGRTDLAGGRFATATLADDNLDGIPRMITVYRLDGQEQATFAASSAADFVERGVAFDGTRISWSTGFVTVVNVRLSDLEPRATRPKVRITRPRGVKRNVRFVFGTASDPDGRVAEVRVGLARTGDCRVVTRSGRLGPSRFPGGVCRPKARFVAQGGEAWNFPLKRRLPRGKYVVRAVARDDTGQMHSAQRRFRIRRR